MDTEANIVENMNLREPQRFAYIEAYNHFEINKKKYTHAIIVLPTGVGKTGLIGILPYNICRGRVLIITPQITIKDTIIGSLNPDAYDNFWISKKVIENVNNLPIVIEYEGKKTKEEALKSSNIIILNIHKLQPRFVSSLLNRVERNFFDMIIIDEAHHSTANSWINTVQYFSDAKVIKLTGTPIRTDKKEMTGELIYKYKLSQAMANGYVKSLVNINYIPDKLLLTIDGIDDKFYTVDEILEIKDEDWVSRSVAYSEDCSKKIVDESVKILLAKKENNNLPHKIIAVACSINHALTIKKLYLQKEVRAEVLHSKLSEFEQKKIKKDIINHRLDVIINVDMLGEGYDHCYLSVAAIFRPYRNELPYAQFIGRILRIIPQDSNITAEDNIGRIVSHNHLYLEKLWEKYKIEIQESEIIKHLTETEDLIEEGERSSFENKKSIDSGKAFDSGIGILEEDVYLSTELLKRKKIEEEEYERKIAEIQKILQITRQEAINIIKQTSETDRNIKRPDLYFKKVSKDLDIEIRENIVPALITKFSIDPKGNNLSDCPLFKGRNVYAWIPQKIKCNDGMLAVYFNSYLKNELGLSREKWNISDYEIAKEKLEIQVEYVEKIVELYLNKIFLK